jgi:hypothetical protein
MYSDREQSMQELFGGRVVVNPRAAAHRGLLDDDDDDDQGWGLNINDRGRHGGDYDDEKDLDDALLLNSSQRRRWYSRAWECVRSHWRPQVRMRWPYASVRIV